MGRAGKIGIGVGLTVSAGALIGGGLDMNARYNDELATDRANAAVAEAFLADQEGVEADIQVLIDDVNARILHFAETVGPACMTVIEEEEPETIDDVVTTATCELNEEQIDDARGLLDDLRDERADYTYWTEPSSFDPEGQTPLESAVDNAQGVVEDAEDASRVRDLYDYTYDELPTTSVRVIKGEVVTTQGSGNRYSVDQPLLYGLLFIAGLGIAQGSREVQQDTSDTTFQQTISG